MLSTSFISFLLFHSLLQHLTGLFSFLWVEFFLLILLLFFNLDVLLSEFCILLIFFLFS
ncbi:hypothetical protein U3516DRAFT_898157 [Neocallimastix sp. 'constans']